MEKITTFRDCFQTVCSDEWDPRLRNVFPFVKTTIWKELRTMLYVQKHVKTYIATESRNEFLVVR